jgi:hypothetical protein
MHRFLVLIIPMLATAAVQAQPAGVSRVLSTFDFEERRLGNVEDLPMHWAKIEGAGLPHYVNGRLSTDRARSGKYSFRFDLNGGSLIYRYAAGQIPVQPGAHYRVEGYVQTTPLPNARTRITAQLTDVDGHLIPGSARRSELYASAPGDVQWHRLAVETTADLPNAAFLIVELELLQPSLYSRTTLGPQKLFDQDIYGSAWFDDVTVAQVPLVTLTTARAGNIFSRSDPLQVQVLVNDRFTDDLSAKLVVRDAEGQTVFQRSGGAVSIASAQVLSPGQKKLSLNLPDLPPGWYQAALEMSSQNQFVGEQTISFIRLADDVRELYPDPRFGVDALALPFAGWSELPELLPLIGAGRVKLAVWNEQGDIQQADPAAFDQLLESFGERQITPTACLVNLPPDVAARVNGNSWERLLSVDRALWQPQLAYLISRHANHLDRWQLGADGTDAFVTEKGMREVYEKVYKEFADLIETPDLAMPWPAWYDLEGRLPATVALSLSSDVLPAQLPLYINDLRGRNGHHLSISLQTIPVQRYGRNVQIRDLAQRFTYALAAGADRIDLPLPFNVQARGKQLQKEPTELLLILRTLMGVLGQASFKGKMPLEEGVEAFLFDRNGTGILMLWDAAGHESTVKRLPINLNARAVRVDLWGNVSPLLKSEAQESAGQESTGAPIEIGPMPFFIVDIDGQIAQFRASVHLDDDKVESSFKEHSRRLLFTNPYPQAISGTVKLRAPAGWIINPPTSTFTLNPGETFQREIRIQFPYNSFAGTKTILADFQVQAEKNSLFTLPINLKLGLSDVGLQTLALRDGKDIVVQQMITNYGEKPIDYTAFAIFPGQARQERLVTNLGAGRTAIKKYRFVNIQPAKELRIRSGIKELQGTRILNDEVTIQ